MRERGILISGKEPVFQMEGFRRKNFYVILPILLVIIDCMGMWFSEAVSGTNNLLLNTLSHMILVVLAFLGILACNLSLVEAGIISPNPRYSFYWGLYLSMSVCVPALVFVGILHVFGLVSLETVGLNIHRLTVSLVVNLMLGGFCEELFFRGFVQGSLNRAIDYGASPIVSGLIFGVVHLANYVNPFTGTYNLDMGAVVWVLLCCFVGVFFGFLRRKCGDIYCPTLFHGSQDFTSDVMSMLRCPSDISIMALGVGWVVFLAITYRQFINSKAHR